MRVALLSYRSKPHCGGQGVYVRHLSRELVALGHEVEVFSGQPYPELDEGVRLTKVPSLDLYREPDPFRTPRPGEIRDAIDLLEVGTMWTAGFPEPRTFALRAWLKPGKMAALDVSPSQVRQALASNNTVKGILICRNGKLEAIESHVTIDATGDGDIACFAGAEYSMGNSRTGDTQNYSQWDIAGVNMPSPTNRDYDMIDNTKISELQRGLFLSHYEAHFYDFHPMLTVRESRRIEGMYVLNFLDAAEDTHFEDVISLASSDFDPHNVGSSEFSKCGFSE